MRRLFYERFIGGRGVLLLLRLYRLVAPEHRVDGREHFALNVDLSADRLLVGRRV